MTIQLPRSDAREPATDGRWLPWCVKPDSGFEIYVSPDGQGRRGDGAANSTRGAVGLVQVDTSTFLVTNPFRFENATVEQSLCDQLQRQGGVDGGQARERVDDARNFTPRSENPTDLASVPRFMRWFENPYGAHTLAAILHDELIKAAPNSGALKSDTLADRFFREMLWAAGVPWLKRWLMWAAVALRTRWAAGSYRRASVVLWLSLATAGIAAFVQAIGSLAFSWSAPVEAPVLLVVAVVLPVVSAPLWGRQAGAALIAAVGAAWILPAALLAAFGYAVYLVLERLAHVVRLR